MKIYSWNVNGIRAIEKKGFFSWMREVSPDIICLQEIKAQQGQLGEVFLNQSGYTPYWTAAERKGYSGTAVYVKREPVQFEVLGAADFDVEGRTQILYYPAFVLINAYFPNSRHEGARLTYKLEFCSALKEKTDKLVADGHHVLICGDYNIAHKPVDLARPKENEGNPGYLPEEREWMESFLTGGYVDTFRKFNSAPDNYTWWSYRTRAREKNIGWRIDYACVDEGFAPAVSGAGILSGVMGSDHCPIMAQIEVD